MRTRWIALLLPLACCNLITAHEEGDPFYQAKLEIVASDQARVETAVEAYAEAHQMKLSVSRHIAYFAVLRRNDLRISVDNEGRLTELKIAAWSRKRGIPPLELEMTLAKGLTTVVARTTATRRHAARRSASSEMTSSRQS